MTACARRALRLTPLLLLAACASVPSPRSTVDRIVRGATLPLPATFDPRHVQAHLDAELAAQAETNPAMVWKQLRNSFALPGCGADPSIARWAHRYTHDARLFERRLRTALPKIAYIQRTAAQHGVPGEFALLPWVESRYRVAPGDRGGSVGIWQIIPSTAKAMGLCINDHYDGRLDLQASSKAVMKLLNGYHRRFKDWRVAVYAYNAGEFATARFMNRHRAQAASQPIPDWAGHKVTEQHLTQLLAIACVVRDPGRFGVSLPTLRPDQQLTTVAVTDTMAMTAAAARAGMPVAELKRFNAGILDDVIDGSSGVELLLPAAHARRFRAAANQAITALGGGPRPRQAAETTESWELQGGPMRIR